MQQHLLILAAWNIARAMSQETANPLNQFISAAQGGAGAINSALSAEASSSSSPTSPSSTSATPTAAPAATSSAAAKHGGLSSGARTGIIVGVVVGVVLLIAFLAGICCCLMLRKRRRRRREVPATTTTEEIRQHPSAPLMAGVAANKGHGHHTTAPSLSQHPAIRQSSNENPFTDSAHTSHTSPDPSRYSNQSQGHGVPGGLAGAAGGAGSGPAHHTIHQDHHRSSTSIPRNTVPRGHNPGESYPMSNMDHHGHGMADATADPNPSRNRHISGDHHHYSGKDQPMSKNQHFGPGLAGAAAAGAAGCGLAHPRQSGEHTHSFGREYADDTRHAHEAGDHALDTYSNEHHPMPESHHAQTMHHGLPPALASGAITGTMAHDSQQQRQSGAHRPLTDAYSGHDHNMHQISKSAMTGGAMTWANRDPQQLQHRSKGANYVDSTVDTHGTPQGPPSEMVRGPAANAMDRGGPYHQAAGEHHHRSSTPPYAQNTQTGPYPVMVEGGQHNSHKQHVLPPAVAAIPPPHQSASQHPVSNAAYPRQDARRNSGSDAAAVGTNNHQGITHDGLRTLPSSGYPAQSTPKETIAGGAALAALQSEEKRRRRQSSGSRSRSRSHSHRRSSGLPTQTNSDRPPTPFLLGGIGQPYEEKHVSILQTEPPSQDLQYYPHNREAPFAPGAFPHAETHDNRDTRGYSTPPQVPSQSPNRANRASTMVDSSYESSLDNAPSSNSEGSYTVSSDPYKPATPHRNIPPWERHQTRYSLGTPPHSAGINPPAVPWESNDPVQQQRRHSPRTSIEAGGRRSSRSPAAGINGQPRRLRFEDLEHEDMPWRSSGQQQGYDTYDAYGSSSGVGKAF